MSCSSNYIVGKRLTECCLFFQPWRVHFACVLSRNCVWVFFFDSIKSCDKLLFFLTFFVSLPCFFFTCVSGLESNFSVASRACWKVLEEVKSEATIVCWKVREEVKRVASRACWKVREEEKSVAARACYKQCEQTLLPTQPNPTPPHRQADMNWLIYRGEIPSIDRHTGRYSLKTTQM